MQRGQPSVPAPLSTTTWKKGLPVQTAEQREASSTLPKRRRYFRMAGINQPKSKRSSGSSTRALRGQYQSASQDFPRISPAGQRFAFQWIPGSGTLSSLKPAMIKPAAIPVLRNCRQRVFMRSLFQWLFSVRIFRPSSLPARIIVRCQRFYPIPNAMAQLFADLPAIHTAVRRSPGRQARYPCFVCVPCNEACLTLSPVKIHFHVQLTQTMFRWLSSPGIQKLEQMRIDARIQINNQI